MQINDLTGLSKPICKLIEVCALAIGKVYKPTHIRRMAKAKAFELTCISAAATQAHLPSKYEEGEWMIDASCETKELLSRAQHRAAFQEMHKQMNIETVIGKAYANLKTVNDIEDTPINNDWILRFFNCIEDVSNDDMQTIWANILTGEIRKPNSFSLRTLDLIKQLTQEEAKLFEQSLQCGFLRAHNLFMPHFSNEYNQYCPFNSIVTLEEAGLIKASSMNFVTINLNEKSDILAQTKKFVAIAKSSKSISIQVPSFLYTNTARELYNIVAPADNIVFFRSFLKFIKESNADLELSLHEITNISNETINYNKKDLL